jgi:hypothetical protein
MADKTPSVPWIVKLKLMRHSLHQMSHADTFTLIKVGPVDPARVCAAFEALATRIQNHDRCDRVTGVAAGRQREPGGHTRSSAARSDAALP